MNIKHSKYKNTGILFELLTRQITVDLINHDNSKALDILKKHFTGTELAKENKLYQTLINFNSLTEGKAESIINTISELSYKLDRKKLNSEKFSLIKEIKSHYDIDDFFKANINNYKTLSSLYTLIESNFVQNPDPKIIINSKNNLSEYLTSNSEEKNTEVYDELSKLEKGERFLVYKMMLENFNKKYNFLDSTQKDILRNYINNISNSVFLKEYVDKNLIKIKSSLEKNLNRIDDQVTKIKLQETINLIEPVLKSSKMKDDYIITLMQYHELNKELSVL